MMAQVDLNHTVFHAVIENLLCLVTHRLCWRLHVLVLISSRFWQ